MGFFVLEVIFIDPRFGAVRILTSAFLHFTQPYPNASACVTNIDDEQDESAERREIVLPLLGVLLQEALKHKLNWLGESQEMDEPEKFQPVEVWTLLEDDQFWDGGYNIKDEIAGEVTNCDLLEILVCSGLLDEIQGDLEHLEDIDDHLNIHHGSIFVFKGDPFVIGTFLIIDIWEHQYEWRHNHVIDDEQGDPEVPHIAECALCIDEVPLQSVFVLADLVVLIDIFINIVDHHFFKVGFSHFL